MATYIPNASDTAQPTEDKTVESAALEFRTLKSYTTRALVAPETGSYTIPALASRAGKVLGFDAAGEPVVVSVSGATDPNLRTDLAAANGSSLVGFVRGESGAISSSVQAKIRRLIINPEDFGAYGGLVNDTGPLQATFDAGVGNIIDGNNNTYKIYASLNIPGSNIVIQNMTLDFSGTSGTSGVSCAGTLGSQIAVTATANKGTNTLAVTNSASLAAGDYIWVQSNAFFAAITNTRLGQVARIKTVNSATSITLYEDLLYNFTLSDSPSVAKLTLKTNIVFKNVRFLGRTSGVPLVGADFQYCSNVSFESCSFENIIGSGISISRCINTDIEKVKIKNIQGGTGIGIYNTLGSYNTKILGCTIEDVSQGVANTGGLYGVNLYTTVADCNFAAIRSVGIQAGPGADFTIMDGNSIQPVEAVSTYGVISSGLNSIITNNSIVGNSEYGIAVTVSTSMGTASCVISGNSIKNHGTGTYIDDAIYVQTSQSGNTIDGLIISNNIIEGSIDRGIHVTATSGDIYNITIANNIFSSAASTFACSLQASSGRLVQNYTITGNVFQSAGASNLLLYSATLPNKVNQGTITGNRFVGGILNPIELIRVQDIVESGNFITGGTPFISADADCRNIYTDRRQSTISTATGATYTVSTQDEYVIANRAGTVTLTLPTANIWPGRELTVKTIQAQTVISNIANVKPIDSDTAGSAILPAVDGAWALLKSDGTNWVIMQNG